MSGNGILISLNEKNQDKLSSAQSDEEVINTILELEEEVDNDSIFELDKAWNILHRSLTDGRLEYDNGEYPLNMCIMNGFQIHEGDESVVSVVPQDKVPDIAAALENITYDKFKDGFSKIDTSNFPVTKDDLEYGWSIFQGLPEFWKHAALKNRAVVFHTDL